MRAVWEQNADLVAEVEQAAQAHGWKIKHNASTKVGFVGFHRYLILVPGLSDDTTIRSKACLCYTETPYSRYYRPSIKGEREAIEGLLQCIRDYENKMKKVR